MRVLWLTAAVFTVDQVTKWSINHSLELYESVPVIENFFYLTYVTNDGMAFGLSLPGGNLTLPILSLIMTIILGIIFWQERSGHIIVKLSLALIMAGALGNLMDRLRVGEVIDFFHFKIGDYWEWYIFNVADSAVTIGMILFLYYSFIIQRKIKVQEESLS